MKLYYLSENHRRFNYIRLFYQDTSQQNSKIRFNKGVHRAQHDAADATTACQQEKVEQVYIKSKCGQYFARHNNLLDKVICWTHCIWAFVLLFSIFKTNWSLLVPFNLFNRGN